MRRVDGSGVGRKELGWTSVLVLIVVGAAFLSFPRNAISTTSISSVSATASSAAPVTSNAFQTHQELESQCGFTQACGAQSKYGLKLVLSVNSTYVKPNGAIALTVTEFNPLSVTNNMSKSSDWKMPTLTWVCGRGTVPYGIALFRGYYTLNNLT